LANDPISAAGAKLWQREDQKAISNIVLSISELERIKSCEMANEVWRTLQTIYQSTKPTWKTTLLKQLTLHKMDKGKNIRKHLNHFFDTVDKLAEMDVEINNNLLTIMLSYSLPSSFANFKYAIVSRRIINPRNVARENSGRERWAESRRLIACSQRLDCERTAQ